MDARLRGALPRVCLYLFLGAFGVRLLYVSQYANSPFFWAPALDGLYHDLLARSIAAGTPPDGPFFRAPLYYYFLAGLYAAFGPDPWPPRLIQALIGSGSCVVLFLLGLRLMRPTVALAGGVAMALYGPLVFFDAELHTPVLEVALDLAMLYAAVVAVQTGRLGWWVAGAMLLGLSAIARPNVLVALPLLASFALWAGPRSSHRRLGVAAVVLAAALAIPLAVTARNWVVAGDPVFIASQGGINLYLGNRPEADGFTPSTPSRYRFRGEYEDSVALFGQRAAEESLGRKLTAGESQRYWLGRSLAFWREMPAAALALTAKKAVLAWTHREIRNNQAYAFIRAEYAPVLWGLLGFAVVAPLGVLGMALGWRAGPEHRLCILFVPLYVVSFVAFFTADRYRLPVIPLLILFAAYAVSELAAHLRERRWRPALRLAPALVVLAAFVNIDWYRTETPAIWAADHWAAGNRYQRMGRLPEAEARFARALSLDPSNAEVWTNLGVVRFQTGRTPDAAACFREAIRLAPGNATGYYDLALCELEAGRSAQARALLQQAVRVEPEHAPSHAKLRELAARGGNAVRPRSPSGV